MSTLETSAPASAPEPAPAATGSATGSPTAAVDATGAVDPATAAASSVPSAPVPDDITVDVTALGEQLLGRWADARRHSRELVARPEFQRLPHLGMDEHRERVLGQLKLLVENGSVHRAFPKSVGGQEDNGGNIASFEELVLGDPSMQIKSGVQWGLFAAAIQHLGTDEHHQRWLPDALGLALPGAFAMTETGHGSDVSAIGTTATYDPATDEWVIHTPFRAAWKDYLGNAALHGRAAVVFAQLITRNVNHGVHAFFVPLRDETGAFLPGVGGEDDGLKGGLNGIDNGRLHFTNVRVPRTNLLNRYGDVDENGVYTSPIASPGRRFFTMLGTLVQGRVSLDGAATVASKLALTIAIRYGSERRQFDGADGEVVLMDYQRHQRRLLPRLAQTYAMSFAHEVFLEKFDAVFSGAADTDADREDLETLAAALKPLSTWAALDIIQEAREACGGQGFLAENRLVQLRADMDIYATFEGDNNVLLQLVAKRLLTDYSRAFAKADAGVMAHYVADQVEEAVVNRSGLRRLAQSVVDFGSTARSVGYVRDTAAQRQLLTDRVETMVAELAGKLRSASKLPRDEAAALFNRHQNALIETARAHGELLQWEAFTQALEHVEHAGTRQVLTWLRDLFGLGLIEKNLAWYVIHGRLSDHRAQAITDYIDDRLLPRLRPHALALTDAFLLRDEHIRAEIATGVERERQEEARAYYADLAARGLAPIDEKDLIAAKKARR
ncbi:acyl-CoA dehydrogenase [Microcella frigidaquae]|uniref:acyl-CoA oxidase n=1 Tax=Microcella frigidaquae TaxID=424758 RepID=A0A840XAV6_9MICO|nr:acyl-CoA dehydrogenase [Microcella frigidaquae]MBB5618195.1 acyl-CoA oxidase [Microcella frigidaquae]NHN44470.1 acyl-CoA dehydrogenase [Microcella frigidaquae]